MHEMDDLTRKEILGEVLMDELRVIREYLEDIPQLKADVSQIKVTLASVNDRLELLEFGFREHDRELKELRALIA